MQGTEATFQLTYLKKKKSNTIRKSPYLLPKHQKMLFS